MTENNHRDDQVGAALRALPIEDSRDGFWADLERDLLQADENAWAERGADASDVGRARTRARRRWKTQAPKVMAVAAATILLLVGVIWALRPPSDETTELQVAGQEDTSPDAGGDDATADDVGGAADAVDTGSTEQSPADSTDPQAVTEPAPQPGAGTAAIDLSQFSGGTTLPIALQPVAGSDTNDVVLYAWTIPATEGFGCEGIGGRHTLVTLDGDGVQVAPLADWAVAPTVVQGTGARIAVSDWCEGDVQGVRTGVLTETGTLRIDQFLRPPEGLFFSRYEPVWSADGAHVLVHLQGGSLGPTLGRFDRETGEVQIESVAGRVLAELDPQTMVVATANEVLIGDQQLLELDEFDELVLRSEVSRDGRHVAISAGDVLVVVDASGQFNRYDTGGPAIWAMDWSPSGQLIFSVEDGTSLYSYDINRPGEFEEALPLVGDWFELEFASGGQTLAVSGRPSPDADRVTRILQMQGSNVGNGAAAAIAPPFGTMAVTVGENPLALRGIGAVQSGMTVAEAEAATGGKLVEFGSLDGCAHAVLAGDPQSPFFMVTTYQENGGPNLDWSEGTIVRIELGRGATTLSGIGIGSTKAEVLAAYGDRIEVTPHKYTFQEGGEYLIFVPVDEADGGYRLVMETFDDVVTEVRSGLTGPVQWVEGCA